MAADPRLPDEQPWAWDDPDLPVDLFLAAFRRTHPTSRYTDLKLRDRWRTGTRIDSDGHFHDYPGNVKSWAEAMDGAEVTHEAKREEREDRAGVKDARRRVDDILELLVELDEALAGRIAVAIDCGARAVDVQVDAVAAERDAVVVLPDCDLVEIGAARRGESEVGSIGVAFEAAPTWPDAPDVEV